MTEVDSHVVMATDRKGIPTLKEYTELVEKIGFKPYIERQSKIQE